MIISLLIASMIQIIPVRSFSSTVKDSFPDVKVILKGGNIIFGQLQLVTEDSVYILPGTKKDAKKGRFYKKIILPYNEVVSISLKKPYTIFILLFGLIGLAGLYLILSGEIPVFDNGFGDVNEFFYISPVIVGGSLWEMLKRKRYFINGKKNMYNKFRLKLKKQYDCFK